MSAIETEIATLSSVPRVIQDLEKLAGARSATPEIRQTAQSWISAISTAKGQLADRRHPLVFVGSVGVGKSSLIAVFGDLLVSPSPTTRDELKTKSMLAIGAGRTTVCEVCVTPSGSGEIGLSLEPLSERELKREITIYAEIEWRRRHAVTRTRDDNDDQTSQEVHRAIRAMAGYPDSKEVTLERGLKRVRNVRPIDAILTQFDDEKQLAEHLIERVNLAQRTQTEWRWPDASSSSRQLLQQAFELINTGKEPTASLPKRLSVLVPDPLPGLPGLDITLIDTRGLDGAVETRRDLQERLRDPRAVVLVCSEFPSAPADVPRAVLKTMSSVADLRLVLPTTLLVLVDQGHASQVNGADGDREVGQAIKADECHSALEGANITEIDRGRIVPFDALSDDRTVLLHAVAESLRKVREGWERTLQQQLRDAESFLLGANTDALRALRDGVDRSLRDTLQAHKLEGAPLTDPLAGMWEALATSRWGSVVRATCRRNGTYQKLNLYAAISLEAERSATAWLDDVRNAVSTRLTELEADPANGKVGDYIRLRRAQYELALGKVIRDYALAVTTQVEEALGQDQVWEVCSSEWGKKNGFTQQVIGHLQGWARRNPGLVAHETTTAAAEIPLLSEIIDPPSASRFALTVRNLRALRDVRWEPEPISVVIGANGSGKTTLVQVLRLLRMAYERGLPEAVATVLGGSSNLRSRGAPLDEPIGIEIRLGQSTWQFDLNPRDGSVDPITKERFTDGNREVFVRDSLGSFSYSGEPLEASAHMGLRALIDRGVHEPALRKMKAFLQGITVYMDPDLTKLRQGSSTTDTLLSYRGDNALTLLRRWHQDRTNRHRYDFVIEGLVAAFPGLISALDFNEAGNTLVGRVYQPGSEQPSPLSNEANGVLQLLVLFCEVAACDDGGVVAIDEPENGLHPYALSCFLRRTRRWAKPREITVLLTTHSTFLLDELTSDPQQIFVMKSSEGGGPMPTGLLDLCNKDWLAGFRIGELYGQGEIGSNKDVE